MDISREVGDGSINPSDRQSSLRVAYAMSRFPKLTETFIIRDIRAVTVAVLSGLFGGLMVLIIATDLVPDEMEPRLALWTLLVFALIAVILAIDPRR